MKKYSITTYNILKAHLPYCKRVVHKLCRENDFVAVQEWVGSIPLQKDDYIATCFTFTRPLKGAQTGTAIISKTPPLTEACVYSKHREFGFLTRKSMVIGTYLVGKKKLTILNCHALNFVGARLWQETIGAWLSSVPEDGSVILIGDFNAWSHKRLDYINHKMARAGFRYAPYSRRPTLKSSHIWVRGITVVSTVKRDTIHTSDHYPITMEFRLPD
jgi:endonuclease/exonuclease/phosphatase (EEP) superfamily protein YafD